MECVLGREGDSVEYEFNRPSGLCCDDYGNVLIADSKNQRVMVYNSEFVFQYEVSTMAALNELKNMSRPYEFINLTILLSLIFIGGFE